ncbi:toxin VasX [Tenacibaculum jejuense]|uniref:Toxin VasX N-terminal region domain-containing protein n=1 Tax=Tenacibaculum jejuense TaxID=584609 RepID=A0A238U618_9FLAO|nr:toxin VasX [Tenacibaculum jejuense]SNR14446.1 Probable transmembrane protein of unknown function [Tenacibaculum jejuense]
MKENLALEENQQKEFKQIIAQYTFHVEHNGIVYDNEKPLLNVEKNGITLHFLRYGLFDTTCDLSAPTKSYTSPDSAAYYRSIFVDANEKSVVAKVRNEPENEPNREQPIIEPSIHLDEVIINADIPNTNNYNIARTPLRAGYVYMINENNPLNDFKEFRVDDYGMIYEIDWAKNKENGEYLDKRTNEGEGRFYKILDRDDQTYCFAYSPVQWSAAYVEELLNDTQKRNQRCPTKVLCKGISVNEDSNDIAVTHYNNTHIVVEGSNPMAYKYGNILHNIAGEEKRQDEEGENTLYEDMFITLDDPIGCADDICVGIDREIDRLKAIMLSCQTAKPDTELFEKIVKGEAIKFDKSEKANQLKYMHALAATTYRFVYDNPDLKKKHSKHKIKHRIKSSGYNPYAATNIEAYEDPEGEYTIEKGISKEKIYKILAVEERREQRAIINTYRDDLGNLIASDYYQDFFDQFTDVDVISLGAAKEIFAEHLIVLGHYPNYYDRDWDLVSEYKPQNDTWLQKIASTLNTNSTDFVKATQVMDATGEIHEKHFKQHHGFLKKMISASGKIGKAYFLHGDILSKYEVIKSRISWFRDFKTGNAIIRYRDINLDAYMQQHQVEFQRIEFDNAYETKGAYLAYKNTIHRNMGDVARRKMDALVQNEVLEIELQNIPKKHHNEVRRLIQSPEFAGLVLLFEVISLGFAIEKYNEDEKNKKEGDKRYLYGAGIKLGAATYQFLENSRIQNKMSKGTAQFFKVFGKSLKLLSSSITVAVNAKDVYQRSISHDYNAAAAWTVATGLGTTLAIAEFSGLIAEFGGAAFFSIGFWPMAVIGGVLIVVCGIAIYLTDSEIEAYFKNFPLSNVAINPESTELPYKFVERLYELRTKTVTEASIAFTKNTQYQKFTDFETAYIALFDIITPGLLKLNPIVTYKTKDENTKHGYATRFKGSVQFFQYFETFEELDFKVWFYPNGIGNPKLSNEPHREEITTFIYQVINDHKRRFIGEKQPSRCEFEFGIPGAYQGTHYEKGEVLVLCRLISSKDEYIPLSHKGIGRYLCLNALTYNTISKHSYSPLQGVVHQVTEHSNYSPLKINRKGYPVTIVDADKIDKLTS